MQKIHMLYSKRRGVSFWSFVMEDETLGGQSEAHEVATISNIEGTRRWYRVEFSKKPQGVAKTQSFQNLKAAQQFIYSYFLEDENKRATNRIRTAQPRKSSGFDLEAEANRIVEQALRRLQREDPEALVRCIY